MICVNRAWLALALVCVGQSSLGAQAAPPNGQVIVLDHVFHGDTDEITLVLRRKVLYRAELYGPGALTVESQRSKRAVFLVPIGDTTAQPRRFELYALANEPHLVRITGLPPGDSASLRILRDSAETERIAEKLDRSASFGVLVAAGAHTGYRLDPTGGRRPGESGGRGDVLGGAPLFGVFVAGGPAPGYPPRPAGGRAPQRCQRCRRV